MFPRPRTPDGEIGGAGGAYVRRRFLFGEREVKPGDTLTVEDINSVPSANLHSLVNTNLIELFPKPPPAQQPDGLAALLVSLWLREGAPPPPEPFVGECFLMAADDAGKKFHVIYGKQMTPNPLNRAAAQAKMKELSP